jgi:hypothetical protein
MQRGRRSLSIGLISVFAALHAVLYFPSFGLWRNWAIYLEPIEGIVLGPWAGFSAAFIGSVTARMIRPDAFWMFGIIAEPIGVLGSGFLAKGKWKPVVAIYAVMLTAYFIHPLGRWLPLWTILDILLAFILIYPIARLSRNLYEKSRRLTVTVPISFVGTVTDALTRVFLLIPLGLYAFLGLSDDAVRDVFVLGATYSYIEDVQVVIVSFLIGIPILLALRRIQGFKYPLT